ncbi:MAG: aspartate--tRNA(Asn) ligase [Clostridia bacterium]|nr:aspartate--tRNA(Asn) ligase [Clostridia bacterium]
MKRIYIKDVQPEQEVIISGWIEKIREQKTMIFAVIKDSTGSIQVAVEKQSSPDIALKLGKLLRHSVVRFVGKAIKQEKVTLRGMEFIPYSMEVESEACDLPIDEASSQELKMDYRWIDLRSEKQRLIFQIRTFAESKMREFFIDKGYIEIHSPKITSQCSEGGAEVFALDYYDQKAYLTQSPQFYKQMAMAGGFDKVFEIGAYYRAEKSFTSRHTAEAVCLDIEVAHVKSHHEVMDIEEEFIKYVLSAIKERYGEAIKEVFGVEVKVPTKPIPRIKLADCFKIFKEIYDVDVKEVKRLDLDPDGEKLICDYARDYLDSDLVFVTDFPAEARAFYSKKIDGSFDCMSFDMLYRGWEMNSGAVREHRYEQLKEQIEEHGVKAEKMEDYLEFFKYGCPPHGGLGFGIDRFLAKLLDLPSLKESIFLFRGPSRLKP